MIYAIGGQNMDAVLSDAPTGLVGTLGIRIVDVDDATEVMGRTTSSILELGFGSYRWTGPAPTSLDDYLIVWDTGGVTPTYATEELTVNATGAPVTPPGGGDFIHTLREVRPLRRVDGLPWVEARIEESESADGPWAIASTQTIAPDDPAHPGRRDFTFGSAFQTGWFRVVFIDGDGDESPPSKARRS